MKYMNDYVKEKNILDRVYFNTQVLSVYRDEHKNKWII
jgi:hypothetical protein